MSVIVVDKPIGPTSFEVVRQVQRLAARRAGLARPRDLRVGHGGTLDPMASGVLPVCLGEATKLAPYLLDADKAYEAAVRFGVETDTLDAAGTVVATSAAVDLDEERVEAALAGFRGPQQQVPPMYSALKHKGRPLHAYARMGEEVERLARAVTIFTLELTRWEAPATAHLRVRCSKGTYVRVLAADLGRALGVGAHLCGLRRTASGPFHLGQAISLEGLAAAATWPAVPLADVLAHLPRVVAMGDTERALGQGKQVLPRALGFDDTVPAGNLRVCRADGTLLAVAALDPATGMIRTLRGFNRTAPIPLSGNAGGGPAVNETTKLSPTVGLTQARFL